MAQLQRNFLKARMNKDLDERLVPDGEYTDALNIQIATSESAQVGSVQSIPSNHEWLMNSGFSSSAQTVGVFNDSEKNHIYNFVCDSRNFEQEDIVLPDGTEKKLLLGVRSDTIYRISPDKNAAVRSTADVVIHDVYEVRLMPKITSSTNNTTDQITLGGDTQFTLQGTDSNQIYDRNKHIRPGMRVQAIDLAGNDVYGLNNKIIVKYVNQVGASTVIQTTGINGAFESLYTSTMADQGVYLKFTTPRILKFRKGDSLELEINNGSPFDSEGSYVEPSYFPKSLDDTRSKIPKSSGKNTYTPYNSYISSISLIDNYLMWTDGRNEPKKINIDRCIKGNDQTSSSKELGISIQRAHHTMLVVESNQKTFGVGYLKESHITTLKPNPCNALEAQAINSSSSSYSNIPMLGKDANTDQSFAAWSLHDNANNFFSASDPIWIKPGVAGTSFAAGTIITLTGQQSSTQVQVQIDSIVNQGSAEQYYVANLITDIPDGYTVESPDEIWSAFVKPNDGLYNQDFVSFSYRYVYSDGEVSCLAPFTSPVFAAGDYAYSSKNGFNLGMQNNIEEIKLHSYENKSMPLDVVSLEFVFKSQKSDNVYSFRTIDRVFQPISNFELGSLVLQYSPSFFHSGPQGSYTIKEKLFGYTIPSDQLTRSFDAVPKKAIAQEIQANRLMYANYTQDYDLVDTNGVYVQPNINTQVLSASSGFGASFSSANILSASIGSYNVVNNDAATVEATPFVLVNDPTTYVLVNLGPQNLYTTPAIQMGVEYDPGDNWDGAVYTAPETGEYTISGFARVRGSYGVYDTGGSAFVYTVVPRNLRLAIYYVAGQTAVGEPLYATGYNNAAAMEANGFELEQVDFTSSGDFPQQNYVTLSPLEANYIYFEATINLFAGNNIALFAQSNQLGEGPLGSDPNDVEIAIADFNVTGTPSSQFDLPSLRGQKSIKSERNYNVGIVYRDELGRESSVLIGDDEDFNCLKEKSAFSNYLSFAINNNAPQWAKTYKLFIKENTSKYSNLVLESAFVSDPQEGDYVYLVFNSLDINKVKIGDYLVAKKQQGTNVAITDAEAKYRIISIIGDAEFGDDGDALTVGNTAVPNSVIATADQLDGKFFVKVFREGIEGPGTVLGVFETGDDGEAAIISSGNNNGAVFEVEPDSTLDLDLYYEISDALPIRLDNHYADKYIRKGSYVSISNSSGSSFGIFSGADYQQLPRVNNVRGAMTNGSLQQLHSNIDAYCAVILDDFANVYVDTSYEYSGVPDTVVTFYVSARESYQAYLAKPISPGDTTIYVLPDVHGNGLKVAPGFYNCISFGNGVESDTIRDDFNAAELLKYTATGKQSGVRASLPAKNYKEYTSPSNIIFSEIYNDSAGSNRFNEFLVSKNIIKQINPDYGSIQKLFSRDNDLLTLCEKKCLRVLSEKDALFNADGNPQLLATDRVLGQAIPFAGDYGISKNPESFAADEYRCYFTDSNRGAVLRLSKDGITPISKSGMDDWFSDHLVNSRAIIGSFDGDKEEYNVTLHEILQPGVSKLVYTVSFSEEVDGWTSFKSYIQDAGLTINNKYYTFKNGLPWRHSVQEIAPILLTTSVGNGSTILSPENDALQDFLLNSPKYNSFYGVQYISEITTLFNSNSDIVKTFRYFNYEGSQARIIQNHDDGEYYNLNSKPGWYCEFINTDLQEAGRSYFVEKEGKWFGYVKGAQTKHKNIADGGTELDTNIDTKEHNIQGLGNVVEDVTLISGTLPSFGYNVYISTNYEFASQLSGPESSVFSSGGSGTSSGGSGGGY